jgi:hypothetical protein
MCHCLCSQKTPARVEVKKGGVDGKEKKSHSQSHWKMEDEEAEALAEALSASVVTYEQDACEAEATLATDDSGGQSEGAGLSSHETGVAMVAAATGLVNQLC